MHIPNGKYALINHHGGADSKSKTKSKSKTHWLGRANQLSFISH